MAEKTPAVIRGKAGIARFLSVDVKTLSRLIRDDVALQAVIRVDRVTARFYAIPDELRGWLRSGKTVGDAGGDQC